MAIRDQIQRQLFQKHLNNEHLKEKYIAKNEADLLKLRNEVCYNYADVGFECFVFEPKRKPLNEEGDENLDKLLLMKRLQQLKKGQTSLPQRAAPVTAFVDLNPMDLLALEKGDSSLFDSLSVHERSHPIRHKKHVKLVLTAKTDSTDKSTISKYHNSNTKNRDTYSIGLLKKENLNYNFMLGLKPIGVDVSRQPTAHTGGEGYSTCARNYLPNTEQLPHCEEHKSSSYYLVHPRVDPHPVTTGLRHYGTGPQQILGRVMRPGEILGRRRKLKY